jgi:L-fuculose-phosphate aldolase
MLDISTIQDLIDIGRDMFLRGLVSSHAGNMSVRVGDLIYITRSHSMSGRLVPADIIEVDSRDPDDPALSTASTEYVVHRAIYMKTEAGAVVHAHPPYATLLSFTGEVVPIDAEGSFHFKRVRVTAPQNPIASSETADLVSEELKESRIVLVRGHGSFARGKTLEEAYKLTSTLESSAFYLYHSK